MNVEAIIPRVDGQLAMTRIADAVSRLWGIPYEELIGHGRKQPACFARQVAMTLCREFTKEGLCSIGEFFDGRDHCTVLWAAKKVREAEESDLRIQDLVHKLREELKKNAKGDSQSPDQ